MKKLSAKALVIALMLCPMLTASCAKNTGIPNDPIYDYGIPDETYGDVLSDIDNPDPSAGDRPDESGDSGGTVRQGTSVTTASETGYTDIGSEKGTSETEKSTAGSGGSADSKRPSQPDAVPPASSRALTSGAPGITSNAPATSAPGSADSNAVSSGGKTGLPYVAPSDMYQPVYETKVVSGGDYILKRGVVGLKVEAVQKALGIKVRHYGRYTEETKNLVTQFQTKNGLSATGTVDLDTWIALGLSYEDWMYKGTYVHPIVIDESFTREQILNEFISVGRSYIGTEFVTGASGKPGEGADCSGFVLQCLYAIGIYPDGLDPVQHSVEGEYNCIEMFNDKKFRKVSYSELQPGDLVFYRRTTGDNIYSVNHVAIYSGNGKCLEAWIDRVDEYGIDKLYLGYEIIGYRRVIF